MKQFASRRTSLFGFTLVELLIVISVLGILVAIVSVSYNGFQRRAAESALISDLNQASALLESEYTKDKSYPESLPAELKTSPKVSLTVSSQAHYSNLSPVQNGVLFYDICTDLINEGYGKGVNNGGGQEQYITACNVYNNPEIQVNSAWAPRNINTPVQNSYLPNLVASINYTDSYRPGRTAAEQQFYQSWHERFMAQGGTYPITSFWDPWASPGNGILKQPVPAPDEVGGGWVQEDTYCVQGRHSSYDDITWYIQAGGKPTKGTCPT